MDRALRGFASAVTSAESDKATPVCGAEVSARGTRLWPVEMGLVGDRQRCASSELSAYASVAPPRTNNARPSVRWTK